MKEVYLIKVTQVTNVYEPVSRMYSIRLKSIYDSVTIAYDWECDNYAKQASNYLISLGINPIGIVHKFDNKCAIVVENLKRLDGDK